MLIPLIFCLSSQAQDFKGIHSSNYFPLQNIYNQPADLVRNERRWQVNILSADLQFTHNMTLGEENYFNSIIKSTKWDNLDLFLNTENLELVVLGSVMLPSVSYKINAKHALAFSIKLPAHGLYKTSNNDLVHLFQGISNPEGLNDLQGEYFKGIVNQWTEFSLSWSGLIWKNKGHQITGGFNLNYLVGGGAGYFDLDGINVSYGPDQIDYFDMEVTYAINKNLGEVINTGNIDLFGDKGFGVDLGVSYSYSPSHKPDIPYLFKLGLVAKNLGSLKYSSDIESGTFYISVQEISYDTFENINSVQELIDTLKGVVEFSETSNNSFKLDLPSSYAFTGDYCFRPNWYLATYLGYQPSFYRNIKNISNNNQWSFGLTPRFENKAWGVYLPFFHKPDKNRLGLALRYKFFFVGSSTLIGNAFTKEQENATLYFGFNVPLGKKLKL